MHFLYIHIQQHREYFEKKRKKYFVSIKKVRTFATAFERESDSEKKDWSGSSVWLEYMPVTHGVASSSLVRTAKQKRSSPKENFFFTPKALTIKR